MIIKHKPCSISRHNTLHLHPVPLNASNSDVSFHRRRHHLLRLRNGPQRLRMAERKNEPRQGISNPRSGHNAELKYFERSHNGERPFK